MKRFVEGVAREQSTLFPDRLEDWIGDDNPVRVVDVFVDELDLGGLGFDRVAPRTTGRPSLGCGGLPETRHFRKWLIREVRGMSVERPVYPQLPTFRQQCPFSPDCFRSTLSFGRGWRT